MEEKPIREEVKRTRKKKVEAPSQEELDNPRTPEQFRLALKRKTKIYYDIQEIRLVTQGRLLRKAKDSEIQLHPVDLQKLDNRLKELQIVENNALIDLDEQLHEVPFYAKCILPRRKDKYRGLGPRMASVILSSFDITRSNTVSQMWAFAGLAPVSAKRCKKCNIVVTHKEGEARAHHPVPVGNK